MRAGKKGPRAERPSRSTSFGAGLGAGSRRRGPLASATALGLGVALLLGAAPEAFAAPRSSIRRIALPSSREAAIVCSRSSFTALALRWPGMGSDGVTARVSTAGSRTGPWGPSEELHTDPSEAADPAELRGGSPVTTSELLWTGPARCARVDIEDGAGRGMSGARVILIDSSAPGGAVAARSVPARARAGTDRPAIVRRARWGANESLRNCPPDYARRLRAGFVHHTAGSNDYSRARSDDVVRAIYAYHTRVRRWCDIGYNFLVDRFGTVYEGRRGGLSQPVVPAAQQGFNRGAFAASVMGNFERRRPPWRARRSLQRLLAWRLDVAHLPADGRAWMTSTGGPNTRYQAGERVRIRVLSGHRRTGFTACPGDELARLLPRIRRAAARIGGPKILRPRASSRSLVAGSDGVVLRARSSVELEWSISVARDGEAVAAATDVGTHTRWRWRGRDRDGQPVAPGRYVVTIRGTDREGEAARPARVRLRVRAAEPDE